jgi:UDP-N-acetylmuramyl pentapeptide phosphotransferase/UDP-N-acetylglucosamine-1-phosphate transferase
VLRVDFLTANGLKLMTQLIQQQFYQILTVALIMIVLILTLKPIAHKISLVDKPNARKSHQNDTPLIGGICIFWHVAYRIYFW